MKVTTRIACVVVALAAGAVLAQEKKKDRETKVRDDKERVAAMDSWIYDDLPRGIEEAKKSGKPLLVVFRCIPCEACSQIDEDVVTRDPVVAKLLDRYVCVRIPHANGMDLDLFRFDYDQSWAAFLLNADLTIYARYGTRSHQTKSEDDVSLEGFAATLEGALDLHARFEEVRQSLASKRGGLESDRRTGVTVARPEEFPSFGGKYGATLDYAPDKKVVPACIHCHQVGEAERLLYRNAGKSIPERLLFPYPNPKVLGLVMDPKGRARVARVLPGSSAEKDGYRAGDEIVAIGGVPMLSIADVQWQLNAGGDDPRSGASDAEVLRDGKTIAMKLTLSDSWSRNDDISWRATSWDLRRMTTGGMLLENVPAEERAKLGVADGAMALRAKHVGQYGEHAAAKNAGFRQGDVVVAVNGRSDVRSETEWMTWLVNAKKPGEKVPVTVLRGGEKVELTLPMQ